MRNALFGAVMALASMQCFAECITPDQASSLMYEANKSPRASIKFHSLKDGAWESFRGFLDNQMGLNEKAMSGEEAQVYSGNPETFTYQSHVLIFKDKCLVAQGDIPDGLIMRWMYEYKDSI